LPVLAEQVHEQYRDAFGQEPAVADFLRFGSWVGGDMDGNPNVGAATIAATLATQRALVLGNYRRELAKLARMLSQSDRRVGFAPALLARCEDYARRFPDAAAELKARHADMPYRRYATLVAARLEAT